MRHFVFMFCVQELALISVPKSIICTLKTVVLLSNDVKIYKICKENLHFWEVFFQQQTLFSFTNIKPQAGSFRCFTLTKPNQTITTGEAVQGYIIGPVLLQSAAGITYLCGPEVYDSHTFCSAR